jgi:hypothetical protein
VRESVAWQSICGPGSPASAMTYSAIQEKLEGKLVDWMLKRCF